MANKKTLKIYLIVCINLLAFQINAQSRKDSTELVKPIFSNTAKVVLKSDFNQEGAIQDINNGKVRVLFPGGFGGMPNFDNEKDIIFQKKYSVKFFSQGCVRMGEDENEEAYNQTVFNYLDEKFGKTWRNEIRKDAIGF